MIPQLLTLLLAAAASAAAQAPTPRNTANNPNAPQDWVVCTGWHALCSSSPDCQVNGDKADCDCYRVNETHIVETASIRDLAVKRRTRIECTNAHPCEVDEAPVCKAIKDGPYIVDNVNYRWISTYSYRGWCGLIQTKPKACDPSSAGYVGDTQWALCDAAPCTETSNPEKPLRCQCLVVKSAFVGANGTCKGENGGIISSMPISGWNFQENNYTFYMPGNEFVHGACSPLQSDPWPPAREPQNSPATAGNR